MARSFQHLVHSLYLTMYSHRLQHCALDHSSLNPPECSPRRSASGKTPSTGRFNMTSREWSLHLFKSILYRHNTKQQRPIHPLYCLLTAFSAGNCNSVALEDRSLLASAAGYWAKSPPPLIATTASSPSACSTKCGSSAKCVMSWMPEILSQFLMPSTYRSVSLFIHGSGCPTL